MALKPSQEQRDAHTILRMTLRTYGLDSKSLADWALESLIAGNSIDQILLELEQRPEYKKAFPEIEERQKRSLAEGIQLTPISPAEILEYRTQAKQLLRSYGLPESFYANNGNFFTLIVNDVSMEELGQRLDLSAKRVKQAPPEVRSVFEDVYGHLSDDALFLTFLNVEATIPALEDMVQVAEAGGAARRLGFGLSAQDMRRVADLNITYDQAVEGFTQLDDVRGLFDETLSERVDFTVGAEGVDAAFRTGAGAADRLARRGEARKAETSGGTGSTIEERGATGLGSAGRR